MAQAAGPFDPILSPLADVIARRRLRTVIRTAIACALAVLAALLVLMAVERFGAGRFDPLPILVAVGIATVLTSALVAWMRRRTPVQEAFFIDRAGGFDEAYGTAVELTRQPATLSEPVPAELMSGVRARIGGVSVARLVRIFTPGFLVALALMIVLGGAAWWLQRVPVPAPTEIAGETAEPADPETVATIAEMLADDAAEREDPLLDAIARTLADRAATAADAPMSEEMQQQINDLLDQAAAAYGEEAPSWLGDAEGMRLTELEDALAAMQAAEAAEAAAPPPTPIEPTANRGDEIMDSPDGPGLYDARPELAEQYAGRDSDEISSAPEAASLGEAATNLEGSPSSGPQLMKPQQLQSIGAIPVGAALDSGRGVSNAAGLGQEDIRADDAFTQLGAAPGEDMVVSAEPQAEGSRIRIEIVPEVAEGVAAGAANAIGGQTGSGSTEPVARDFVPATARDIAARYFERIAQ